MRSTTSLCAAFTSSCRAVFCRSNFAVSLLPLGRYTRFLVVAPGGGVGSELLAQIVDLLVERLQIILLRGKLRLQFRGGLLPFRGRHNGLPDIDRADFRASRRARCSLPMDGCGAK